MHDLKDAAAAAAAIAGDARRRATVIAAAVLCLLLAVKVAWAAATGGTGQLPFVVAPLVLPLLFAFPGPRLFLTRHRWQVLAVQAVLTWTPFAIYGGRWVVGIGGLLAALVLLTVRGRVSWLVAGVLLAADVTVRVSAVGVPLAPAWYGAIMGGPRLRGRRARPFRHRPARRSWSGRCRTPAARPRELAVGRERLQAAEALQSALGERLAASRPCRGSAPGDPGKPGTGARSRSRRRASAARTAVARARAVTADPAAARPG